MACVAADEPMGRRLYAPSGGGWLYVMVSVMVFCGSTAACGQTARPPLQVDQALTDPRPSERVAAVSVVGRGRDRSHVPDLIDMLDDPDPAVRLTAGATLRDLTGFDTGYQPWADVVVRRAHVQAWRRWWVGETPRPVLSPPVRPVPSSAASQGRVLVPPPATVDPTLPAPSQGLPPPVIRVVRGAS